MGFSGNESQEIADSLQKKLNTSNPRDAHMFVPEETERASDAIQLLGGCNQK